MSDLPPALDQALAGRYRIVRELGRGGMATVYLAEDLRHQRLVALKVLKPELAHALGPDRFLREIRLTAQLDHPHILPLLDSGSLTPVPPLHDVERGQGGEVLFYVMPYVEGESLRDRLERERQLPLEDALQIAREVADALGYAHSRGIVHRDIKPENILLAGGHARVADFGIARAVTSAGGEALTETGIAIGTPSYMSPEQSAGDSALDGRSDIYALGCVLYEMLAGRPPFTGVTAQEILARHAMDTPPSLTAARPALSRALELAIARAMAKVPADRYATAQQFAGALRQAERASGEQGTATAPVRPVSRPRPWWPWAAALLLVSLVATGLLLRRGSNSAGQPAAPAYARTAIAVLPFVNLTGPGPYGYFAGGLHDELLTELSRVTALKVIGRASVAEYADSSISLQRIARELGVGSVVEGSVQAVGDRLRVNVQLVDVATNANLWAERYDRTLDDAFAIQSEVAQRIVAAVGATLSAAEQEGLTRAPTGDPEAYRLYLQGRQYLLRPTRSRQDYEMAVQFLTRATEQDSTFALAYADLAEAQGLTYLLRYDPSPARLALAREAAHTAVRLAPDLPQAQAAMIYDYGLGRQDWQRALSTLTGALKGIPNDARLWERMGFMQRRLKHWPEAIAAFRRATDLDPRDPDLFQHLAVTYDLMHRYADAAQSFDRVLALSPGLPNAVVLKGWTYIRWQGTLDTLRAGLDRLAPDAPGSFGGVTGQRVLLQFWERDPEGMLRTLRGDPAAAFDGEDSYTPAALYAGWAHRFRGNEAAAAAAFDSALTLLDSVLVRLPNDWRVHVSRGLTLAALGRREAALQEARWIQGPASGPGGQREDPDPMVQHAQILAQLGDAKGAVAELPLPLRRPSWVSIETLRLDPLWDPIREDSAFQALLRR